jgi:hypothetical protein
LESRDSAKVVFGAKRRKERIAIRIIGVRIIELSLSLVLQKGNILFLFIILSILKIKLLPLETSRLQKLNLNCKIW